jgi:hypothetical protein
MKSFDDYKDGDWVVYNNPNSSWHLMSFQAYKSQWTHNAFRLKYGSREVVADISEIRPISDVNNLMKETNENTNRDLQCDSGRSSEEDYQYQD